MAGRIAAARASPRAASRARPRAPERGVGGRGPDGAGGERDAGNAGGGGEVPGPRGGAGGGLGGHGDLLVRRAVACRRPWPGEPLQVFGSGSSRAAGAGGHRWSRGRGGVAAGVGGDDLPRDGARAGRGAPGSADHLPPRKVMGTDPPAHRMVTEEMADSSVTVASTRVVVGGAAADEDLPGTGSRGRRSRDGARPGA